MDRLAHEDEVHERQVPVGRTIVRQVTPVHGPALGSGPAYAISGPTSVASPEQFGGGVSA